MAGDAIRITGLREFRLKLRALDKALTKGLRKAGNRAAKIVVDTARPRVPVGPGRGGHAASSIKAASTQRGARVSEGGARYPYMPWLDFGGEINKHTAHPTVRPFLRPGRFIWAAFGEHQPAVERELLLALHEVAAAADLHPEFGGIG